MKHKNNIFLLREYVSKILNENEYDGGGGDYGYDGGGGVGGYGSGEGLYKIFVQPFADVIGVVAGKTKELARRSITVLQVAFETIMTTLIPVLTDSYDEIFAAEATAIDKIKSEYSSYYQASDHALNSGLASLALIAFPGAALTGKFVENSPKAVKNILSIATGGLSDKYLGEGRNLGKSSIRVPKGSGVFDSYARSYAKLLSEDKSKEKKKQTLSDKLGSKKFIDKLLNRSPLVGAAAREAQEVYKKTLHDAFEEAKSVLLAKNIEDIEKTIGKKLNSDDALKKLDSSEKQKSKEQLLKTIKDSARKIYVTRLEAQVAPVIKIFGENFPFVVDYLKTINKIKSL